MDTKIEHIEERLHIIEQKVDKILGRDKLKKTPLALG